MKKILCIIPFYNRAFCLRDAIESVLQQTYKNVELVLVNDGSTDSYLEVVQPYLKRDNVHFVSYDNNKGVSFARNQGLKLLDKLKCDFYTIHDSDDISDINRFTRILEQFEQDVLAVRPTYVQTDFNCKPVLENGSYKIKAGEGIAVYSKKVFEILGYFHNLQAGEDTDYWWRLEGFIKQNSKYRTKKHDQILYYARIHNSNISSLYKSNYPFIWSQIRNDVYEMSKTGNFYRSSFK